MNNTNINNKFLGLFGITKKKSLAGLDNVATEGNAAIKTLCDAATQLAKAGE